MPVLTIRKSARGNILKQISIALVLFSLLPWFFPSNVSADLNKEQSALLGRNYSKMSLGERISYVTGVVHGMTLARPIDEADDMVPWLHDCIANLPPNQLDMIVSGYIKKHPELNDARLDVLTFLAFQRSCRKKR